MSIGLQKEEILKILVEQGGFVSGNAISAELITNAIATIITENNKLIEKELKNS